MQAGDLGPAFAGPGAQPTARQSPRSAPRAGAVSGPGRRPRDSPGTVTWYAFKLSDTTFGIFDTFSDEAGRQAHLSGPIAAALGQAGPGLLAKDPDIQQTDILAAT